LNKLQKENPEALNAENPREELFEARELEQQVRDITFKTRKLMNDLSMRMFLRTTVCFKNIGVF
jgi:hypothetical protein